MSTCKLGLWSGTVRDDAESLAPGLETPDERFSTTHLPTTVTDKVRKSVLRVETTAELGRAVEKTV